MRPLACLCLLGFVLGCATTRPVTLPPMSEGCSDVAKALGQRSRLHEGQKRAFFSQLMGKRFNWKVRVLAASEQPDPLDQEERTFMVDAECLDWPRVGALEGMRYLLTLYVDAHNNKSLSRLVKGSEIELQGTLTSYEGNGAFAARGFAVR